MQWLLLLATPAAPPPAAPPLLPPPCTSEGGDRGWQGVPCCAESRHECLEERSVDDPYHPDHPSALNCTVGVNCWSCFVTCRAADCSPPPPPASPPTAPPRCDGLTVLDFARSCVAHGGAPQQNNLGGKGPDSGAQEMRFGGIGIQGSGPYDLIVTVAAGSATYRLDDNTGNRCSSNGLFAAIRMKVGSSSTFEFAFRDASTDTPVSATFEGGDINTASTDPTSMDTATQKSAVNLYYTSFALALTFIAMQVTFIARYVSNYRAFVSMTSADHAKQLATDHAKQLAKQARLNHFEHQPPHRRTANQGVNVKANHSRGRRPAGWCECERGGVNVNGPCFSSAVGSSRLSRAAGVDVNGSRLSSAVQTRLTAVHARISTVPLSSFSAKRLAYRLSPSPFTLILAPHPHPRPRCPSRLSLRSGSRTASLTRRSAPPCTPPTGSTSHG
jgi:hypothetical protein